MPKKQSVTKRDDRQERKICINVPFPESLMQKIDYLLEVRAIRSKSSFIRDAVAEVAARDIKRALKIQEAIKRIDAGKA